MIKLIGKDKETGAMVIENCADFNRLGVFNFILRVERYLKFRHFTKRVGIGFDGILFWIETDKVNER